MKNWALPIDFLATFPHYIDHLAPIYFALDEDMRGDFFVPERLVIHAEGKGIEATGLKAPKNRPQSVEPFGNGPLITCGYRDLQKGVRQKGKRPQIFLQHGVGLTFPNNPAYAGGTGYQKDVDLFLHPNLIVKNKVEDVYPDKAGEVIGIPKMDNLITKPKKKADNEKPVVCVSFHWDGKRVAAEAGNAFEHYKGILPQLAKSDQFELIGHGHPRFMDVLGPYFRRYGIEVVHDFDEVMERADIYVNDCSSTLYEFCVTGKPVIILNAPWFRRGIAEGIRFWDYTDIGPQVEKARDLPGIIEQVLDGEDPEHKAGREKAVKDLFPYLGKSAEMAGETIMSFIEGKGPPVREITHVDGDTVGIVYMSFGKNAAREIRKSMNSLRQLGISIPVCAIGDSPVRGAQFIEWEGESPFDAGEKRNFQFRAGRVKPKLYEKTPFDRTLYIDADTEFISDIMKGFETLGEHDVAIAHEIHKIGELYNKPRAGWEINILERDATIEEIGGNPNIHFLNSGVIFYRKSKATKKLMKEWHQQWLRWKQWDEQLSLMRAIHKTTELKIMVLSTHWNHPHKDLAKIIFHNYGRGSCRSNVS